MKTVKHLNVMHPNPGIDQEGYDYFYFVCRGCTMRNRQSIWEGYCSSMSDPYNKEIDNSYLSSFFNINHIYPISLTFF